MKIYPAIDLKNNQCVRLYQGDFEKITHYQVRAVEVAKQYEQSGSQYLHIVDLDAAKQGASNHAELIKEILTTTKLSVQVGGGIREQDQLDQLFSLGVSQVVIGSKAVNEPEIVKAWIKNYGAEKFVLAVDFIFDQQNQAKIATHGWQQSSNYTVEQFIEEFLTVNLKTILCTDISRDGTFQGPNCKFYCHLKKLFPTIEIQASGGVASLNDLQQLKQNNIDAVIIGRALYEGKFKLEEALNMSCHASEGWHPEKN